MGRRLAWIALALLPALLASWSWRISAQRPPELVVIVNPSNPERRLNSEQLEAIFTASQQRWSNGDQIVAFNFPPSSPERTTFDRAVLRLDPNQVSRFWIDQRIRGATRPPRQVPSASIAVRVIARMGGGVGYVPAATADATVKIVARVRDGRVTGP